LIDDPRALKFVSSFPEIFSNASHKARPVTSDVEYWDWSLIRKRCTAEALRILRRPQDAEEAVQEALARAWRGRHTCHTPEAPLPWCLQITRNEALRLIGRRRPWASVEPLEDDLAVDGDFGDHSSHQETRVLAKVDVERALESLSPPERQLVALRYGYDCTHSEIAETLEIPEATARVRLHRVHKRLKPLL
jgi:RNA polymerase sigma-70 factor (ECF subfamily)